MQRGIGSHEIDTSVILAALDPLDPKQKPAREILERNEDKAISELVILELASVLTRREISRKLKRKLGLREELIPKNPGKTEIE